MIGRSKRDSALNYLEISNKNWGQPKIEAIIENSFVFGKIQSIYYKTMKYSCNCYNVISVI